MCVAPWGWTRSSEARATTNVGADSLGLPGAAIPSPRLIVKIEADGKARPADRGLLALQRAAELIHQSLDQS